jgi:hypothetical protein
MWKAIDTRIIVLGWSRQKNKTKQSKIKQNEIPTLKNSNNKIHETLLKKQLKQKKGWWHGSSSGVPA